MMYLIINFQKFKNIFFKSFLFLNAFTINILNGQQQQKISVQIHSMKCLYSDDYGKNEEILMAVLPCMLSYSYIFRKLASVPTSRESRYWDFIKDYADEQYAESCKEWSAFAGYKCAGLSEANKKYLADIFEKASLLELAFWKMAYRNERMEENAK